MENYIELIGANENNLNNINLKIPKNQITVFTGVSGSGKSSIVFDTIYQEAKRELNETYDAFVRFYLPKASRPQIDSLKNISLSIAIDQKSLGGNKRSTVGTITDINPLIRLLFSRYSTPKIGPSNYFSFNDPAGMCEECEGIGKITTLNVDNSLDIELSLNEGAIILPGHKVGTWYWKIFTQSGLFDNDKKIKDYTEDELNNLLYKDSTTIEVDNMNMSYEGLVTKFIRQNIKSDSRKSDKTQKQLEPYVTEGICPSCEGQRFNPKVLKGKINGKNIVEYLNMQIDELADELNKIDIEDNTVTIEIIKKLDSLVNVGLQYLSLSRETSTLSGGESQRIKMVKHLTNSLTDVIYIFDEPSTGLHIKDVHKLNEMLVALKEKGNTLLIVEHDPDVIKIADHIIDVGPRAGKNGGNISFEGSYNNLLLTDTLTGQFLQKTYEINDNPRLATDYYTTSKSSLNNLKDVSLSIPKNIFTVVTGVAGSGKSTLVNKVFLKEHPNALFLDQKPIHTNVRSNALTFLGIMDDIRKLFAKENSQKPALFSYNSKGGCEKCGGKGSITLNLAFMDDTEVVCDLCNGNRFNKEVLQYTYKSKNIVEILDMSVDEALDFFDSKKINDMLSSLKKVGLTYLVLGQALSTISGGEAQRLKLAKELLNKNDIYIFDEPTTGLHLSDIELILNIINGLVEDGSTVVVIEHNLEVIKAADYMIDLGPEGGKNGGEILYEGPLNKAKDSNSITAKYL